jgi:hypothetical protein
VPFDTVRVLLATLQLSTGVVMIFSPNFLKHFIFNFQASLRVRLFSADHGAHSHGSVVGTALLPLRTLEEDQTRGTFPRNAYYEGSDVARKIKHFMQKRPFQKGIESQQWRTLSGGDSATASSKEKEKEKSGSSDDKRRSSFSSQQRRPTVNHLKERRNSLDRQPLAVRRGSSTFIADIGRVFMGSRQKLPSSRFELQVNLFYFIIICC